MRNVRSALLAAVVGLSLTTACSFSSSRSWGSANNADPNGHSSSKGKPALQHSSKGKPAQQTSKGKPAQKNPAPAVTPTPTPVPAPTPAPTPTPRPPAVTPVDDTPPARVPRDPPARVPRDDVPTRVPRDDAPSSGTTTNPGTTIGVQPRAVPADKARNGGAAPTAPRDLSVAPTQPQPQPAPNNIKAR